RGRDRPHSAGQDHLWQRPQAARPAADQARQHPAGGADRLPAPRDEVRRPGDPGHARTGQRPRTGRGVRAHHPQPDLRLPGNRAGRPADADRLDGGRGHVLHHLRRRGQPRRNALRPPGPGAVTGQERAQRMLLVLAAFFVANALLAEFIGVKIFALEDTLGVPPWEWNLFGQRGSLNFTAGTLLWPIVFVMTDVINEFYGKRGVRLVSWLAVALILYGF